MVSPLGFLEYARSIFFEKDWLKVKLLMSSKVRFPQLVRDERGFVGIFAQPTFAEGKEGNGTISLMGFSFPDDAQGKRQLVSLFRASVFHIGGHVLFSNFDDYKNWRKEKNSLLAKFIASVIEDANANAHVSARYPDNMVDYAFANALALRSMRRVDRLVNPATRMMAGLLICTNTGQANVLSRSEQSVVSRLGDLISQFKGKAMQSSNEEEGDLKNDKTRIADEMYSIIEDAGPITECPFLPYTEEIGPCSIFSRSCFIDSDMTLGTEFAKCLEFLGGTLTFPKGSRETWRKMAEAEAVQVFDSWKHQREKDQKVISKYKSLLTSTRFKSVEIPEEDYTEYGKAKARCKSEGHRLIESLLVARDALDEDPRKIYGVLDLQEVIQVIAGQSPRMDVFMLDENLSKSYSWVILLDVSRSMKVMKDFALEILTILGDVANEILLDPSSWGMYAFNDRFFIIKDQKERYNERVKSRLGGVKFEGSTYLPDALDLAGQIIKVRSENARLITVISDGWPRGYSDMDAALSKTLNSLLRANITVIGVGTRTHKMETLFKTFCTVYDLRDLSKKFSNVYFETSRVAVDS